MKPSLFLLHGALGSSAQFAELKNLLFEKYSVRSFDFIAHGSNCGKAASFSLEELAEQLLSELKKVSSPSLVFGYSMGGYVALLASIQSPELFSGILTLATKFDWTEETVANELRHLNPEKIKLKVPQFAVQLEKLHGKNWEQLLYQTAAMMQRLGKKKLLDEIALNKISIPVCLSLGDSDKMVSNQETVWASSTIRNSKTNWLESTEHPLEIVSPEKIGSMINSFAGSLTP